jgi:hypothetical protein
MKHAPPACLTIHSENGTKVNFAPHHPTTRSCIGIGFVRTASSPQCLPRRTTYACAVAACAPNQRLGGAPGSVAAKKYATVAIESKRPSARLATRPWPVWLYDRRGPCAIRGDGDVRIGRRNMRACREDGGYAFHSCIACACL